MDEVCTKTGRAFKFENEEKKQEKKEKKKKKKEHSINTDMTERSVKRWVEKKGRRIERESGKRERERERRKRE